MDIIIRQDIRFKVYDEKFWGDGAFRFDQVVFILLTKKIMRGQIDHIGIWTRMITMLFKSIQTVSIINQMFEYKRLSNLHIRYESFWKMF